MKRRPTDSRVTANRIRVDPRHPDATGIGLAADLIREEGVVVFPTTGLYGLGADAFSVAAVRRVFDIKRRPSDMPVLVLLSGLGDMDRLVRTVPDYAQPLLALWPGAITFVFEAGDAVPAALTAGTGRIGVRLPIHPVARALVDRFGGPITGTSANISGRPAAASGGDLDPDICRQADLILDAGSLAGGKGSTILDLSVWPVRLIREGAVPWKAIDDILYGR